MTLESDYNCLLEIEMKSPFHGEEPDGWDEKANASNPRCGDYLAIFRKDRSFYFSGSCCLIAKASASVMCRSLEGHSAEALEEGAKVLGDYLSKGCLESEEEALDRMIQMFGHSVGERLRVLFRLKAYKSRHACIMLPWNVKLGEQGLQGQADAENTAVE